MGANINSVFGFNEWPKRGIMTHAIALNKTETAKEKRRQHTTQFKDATHLLLKSTTTQQASAASLWY